MTDPRDVLTLSVAGLSVADSLAEAITAGVLDPGEDGVWRPPTDAARAAHRAVR
ncbi:hypothetical protein [Rhodospirillum rubrum]|uniref:hypothetical protein n=1 Tax=Rhodospirillum rubrum TaxID=1085 RepID=UPI00190503C0|nr:hypothetical protein [Rhodospirillum rubrum]